MLIRKIPQGLNKSDNLLHFNERNITTFFKEFKELYSYNKVLLSENYIYKSIYFILKEDKERYKELIKYNAIN